MGDPAGIGPEVIVKAASVPDVFEEAQIVVYGDVDVLARAVRESSLNLQVLKISSAAAIPSNTRPERQIWVVPVSDLQNSGVGWGQPVEASDRAQAKYIYEAVSAIERKEADALVTGPIHKVALRRAGVDFPGHTEMLAQLTKSGPPVMMLAGPTLKVVPLTTHVPLVDVPGLITKELLLSTIATTHQAFIRSFGLARPRIAIAGLNPHAGEDGLFGDEEQKVVVPAVKEAKAQGLGAVGPLPADSVFHRAMDGEFDVVIGMYHDQALIPVKLLDFDEAVNVTLGLSIIRTSVDHGTAYDIAGQGIASARSMIAALRMASRMARDTKQDGHQNS